MSITLILQAIMAALQFPGEVMTLVKFLRATPEQQRQNIMAAVQVEADKYQQSGRPTWD